jgi:hypothetical protein
MNSNANTATLAAAFLSCAALFALLTKSTAKKKLPPPFSRTQIMTNVQMG